MYIYSSKNYLSYIIILLIVIIIFPVSVQATELDYLGIEETIQEDLSVKKIITMKFDSPIFHLDYPLKYKIYNFISTVNFDSADCKLKDLGMSSEISCNFKGMTKDKNLVKFEFLTKGSVATEKDKYIIKTTYDTFLPIKRVFAMIKLPEKSILSEEPTNQSYTPRNGGVLTDGRRIMVYWEKENLDAGDALYFSVSYKMSEFGGEIYLSIIIIFVILVLIAVPGFFVYRKKSHGKRKEAVVSVLNKDEKVIYDILVEKNGEANQKVLVRESDFSKAKVSRILKNMKNRKIIEIEPISGRENKVILKTKS